MVHCISIGNACVASCHAAPLRSEIPRREFGAIQEDLEERISKLKTSLEPKSRLTLLREVKALLEEADLVLQSEQD